MLERGSKFMFRKIYFGLFDLLYFFFNEREYEMERDYWERRSVGKGKKCWVVIEEFIG